MGACVQHFQSWKENTVSRILAGYNSPLKSIVVHGIAFAIVPTMLTMGKKKSLISLWKMKCDWWL